jgi:hypothetical protein
MENSQRDSLSKPVKFGEIDFEEIEWRSEYRPTKLYWLPLLLPLLFTLNYAFQLVATSGEWWKLVLYGLFFLGYFSTEILELIKYKSRIVITGQGITLKRPLLKDIEIGFAELGELDYRESWRNYDRVGVTIHSLDGRKKIIVDQKLERFVYFAEELERRWGKALERYQGYAKGTQLRQPERYTELHARVQQMRQELLIEEKANVERLQQRLKS